MSTSTQSQTNSVSAFKLECRKFLFLRCWKSIILTLFLQIELLVLFLLAVNFDLLHPVAWIRSVIARLFSIFTWVAIIPLLIAVLAQLLVLLKYNVTARQYYNKRFKWLASTVTLKFIFLCLQMSIGLLSALYYARFLHMDYSQMTSDCFGAKCLNSYYTYLLLLGLTTGCYHFVREYARKSPDLEFAIIQEYKFVKLRSTLYTQIQRALMSFVLPLVCFTFAYWLLSGIINRQIAGFFKVELDFNMGSIISVFCNVRLLFYGWILAGSILSNMQVMQSIACIVMTEEVDFVIERDPLLKHNAEITLAECISMTELPLIQTLAALNLYNISLSKAKAARRQELFRLSVPGGHPYNWNQLSTQCLAVLNNFTTELVGASKNISTSNTVPLYQNYDANDKHAAEKILLRQYNLMHGIRDLTAESQYKHDSKHSAEHQSTASGNKYLHERIINHFEHFSEQLVNSMLRVVYSVPGMHYIFAEEEGARVAFLLSNSQAIVWIAQGLAGVCAASLTEDKYGVVQDVLPDTIKSLLKLKLELDKLNNVNLNGKKLDRSFYVLKQALKRSLYKISDAFGNYMCDLLNNPDDIRQMQGFLNYQEI